MERETGFEPATHGLEGRCATVALLPRVGAGGLEPPASRSQTARSNRPELRPGADKYSLFGPKRQTKTQVSRRSTLSHFAVESNVVQILYRTFFR